MKNYKILRNIIFVILLIFLGLYFWSDIAQRTLVIIFIIFFPFLWFSGYYASRILLEKALKKENLILKKKRYKILNSGPFPAHTLSAQSIWQIKVEDIKGNMINGWACVGGFFVGALSRKVKLSLDREDGENYYTVFV